MAAHPTLDLCSDVAAPSRIAIAAARQAAGHTLAQAAAAIGSERGQTWQDYEAGRRAIPQAAWALYLLATDQHPAWRLQSK